MASLHKLTFLVFLVFLGTCQAIEFGAKPPKVSSYTYNISYYPQRIDHFNFVENGYFKQRYLINDTYWDKTRGGPIFFYTGNEGDIEAFAQNSGFMWDSAPLFNALLVFAEHRYYGTSLPFGNDSLTPDPKFNGYLTSEQALADYAELLTFLKSTIKGAEKSPVIAFGGSYGGMLAAWFRLKYPHICAGAIAASAPVAQFDAPCDAFGRIVTADYSSEGDFCSGTIRKSWAAIDNVTSTKDGMDWVNKELKFCKNLATKPDVTNFKNYLNNLWTNVAMMDYPYSTSFLMPLPGNPVQAVCQAIKAKLDNNTLTNENRTIIRAIEAGVNVYNNFTGTAKCLNMDDEDQIGANMWDYQACTEMVMPMCFDNENDMFEKAAWNFTAFREDCKARWKVEPRPHMADTIYGAKKLYAASNIIFSNGLLDPWSSGGILRNVGKSVIALIIPEGAHHLDLRGADPNDPQSVVKARELEQLAIKKWINQARRQNQDSDFGPGDGNIVTDSQEKLI